MGCGVARQGVLWGRQGSWHGRQYEAGGNVARWVPGIVGRWAVMFQDGWVAVWMGSSIAFAGHAGWVTLCEAGGGHGRWCCIVKQALQGWWWWCSEAGGGVIIWQWHCIARWACEAGGIVVRQVVWVVVLLSKMGGVREGGWCSWTGWCCCETIQGGGGNIVALRVRKRKKKKKRNSLHEFLCFLGLGSHFVFTYTGTRGLPWW